MRNLIVFVTASATLLAANICGAARGDTDGQLALMRKHVRGESSLKAFDSAAKRLKQRYALSFYEDNGKLTAAGARRSGGHHAAIRSVAIETLSVNSDGGVEMENRVGNAISSVAKHRHQAK
jgi:hypothetical protein